MVSYVAAELRLDDANNSGTRSIIKSCVSELKCESGALTNHFFESLTLASKLSRNTYALLHKHAFLPEISCFESG